MPKRSRDNAESSATASGTGSGTIVRLNVGGELMSSTLSTLRSQPASLLGRMFDEESRFGEPLRDESGAVFLDADPEAFRVILNYLRRGLRVGSGTILEALPVVLRNRVHAEADYFGLAELALECEKRADEPKSVYAAETSLTRIEESVGTGLDILNERLDTIASNVDHDEKLDDIANHLSGVSEHLENISERFESIISSGNSFYANQHPALCTVPRDEA